MTRVGILTFHCPINYGAVLQAYGLQTVLAKLGINASIIDYRPEFLLKPYRIFKEPLSDTLKKNFLHPYTLFIQLKLITKRFRRHGYFRKFITNNLILTSAEKMDDMDVIVVGSDQVWNLCLTQRDISYFLPGKRAKKIAYAVSVGDIESFKTECSDSIVSLLQDFDSISVRESELENLLNSQYNIHAQTVLDPVLLAGSEAYMNFVDSSLIPSGNYLLYFSLSYSESQHEFAKRLASSQGIDKVIALCSMGEYPESHDKKCVASIQDFISLIYGAKFIVTTSFHATAFSILFRKEFLIIGKDKKHASRMIDLMKNLNISNRIIMDSEINAREWGGAFICTSIDYESTTEIMQQKRDGAILFLKSSLLENRDNEDRHSNPTIGT